MADINFLMILCLVQWGLIYGLVNRLLSQSGMRKLTPTDVMKHVEAQAQPQPRAKAAAGSKRVTI